MSGQMGSFEHMQSGQQKHAMLTKPRQATVNERRATEMLVVPAAFMSRVSCVVDKLLLLLLTSAGGGHRLLELAAGAAPLKGGSSVRQS